MHRGCNVNVKLNHKVPVIFHNLKNYDSHLIIHELEKFNPKLNVVQNGLEKYMSCSINNKLNFIDTVQFDDYKDDFKYLSQEFDHNVLDLAKRILSLWIYEWFWKVQRRIASQRKAL